MAGVDKRTLGSGTAQAVLLPFVWGHPLLVFAVAGHVVAVIVVTTVSLSVLRNWSLIALNCASNSSSRLVGGELHVAVVRRPLVVVRGDVDAMFRLLRSCSASS